MFFMGKVPVEAVEKPQREGTTAGRDAAAGDPDSEHRAHLDAPAAWRRKCRTREPQARINPTSMVSRKERK
jgi:hypothetical protein